MILLEKILKREGNHLSIVSYTRIDLKATRADRIVFLKERYSKSKRILSKKAITSTQSSSVSNPLLIILTKMVMKVIE
jgi:hypothetical protein